MFLNSLVLNALTLSATLAAAGGELVIDMVKTGATVAGIEIDDFLVEAARENLKQNGLHGHAAIIPANLWDINLCHFSKLFIDISGIDLERLERKLLDELFVGTMVATPIPQFPHWKPEKQLGTLYVYRR